jgi:hypothetical protein
MTRRHETARGVNARLHGYVEDMTCASCGTTCDAGEFLRNDRRDGAGTLMWVGICDCQTCNPARLDYEPGVYVREWAAVVSWRQRDRDGEFGRPQPIRAMQFRLMPDGTVRPQPRFDRGRRPADEQLTFALEED